LSTPEVIAALLAWLAAATGQPAAPPAAVAVVPSSYLHAAYCEAVEPYRDLDDCLGDAFNTPGFYDARAQRLVVAARYRPEDLFERAGLLVHLVHGAAAARLASSEPGDASGHADAATCAVQLERRAQELATSYLLDHGVRPVELPGYRLSYGMAPWSCTRPSADARVASAHGASIW
jgi:hypothetical protein